MYIQQFENIIDNVTQKHIDDNVNVEIYSAFGGMTCWEGKLSEVLDVIKNEEDREVNKDYFVSIKT